MLDSIRRIYGNYVTSVKHYSHDELIQAKDYKKRYFYLFLWGQKRPPGM